MIVRFCWDVSEVRHPQAVEAGMRHLDLDEELLPATRRLEREIHGEFLFGLGDLFKQGPESAWHRNRKSPVLASFGRGERDFVLGEFLCSLRWIQRLKW